MPPIIVPGSPAPTSASPAPTSGWCAPIPRSPLEDPALEIYHSFIQRRIRAYLAERERICTHYGSLRAYADLHLTLGVHRVEGPSGSLWRCANICPMPKACG